jgi:hypothetical protein
VVVLAYLAQDQVALVALLLMAPAKQQAAVVVLEEQVDLDLVGVLMVAEVLLARVAETIRVLAEQFVLFGLELQGLRGLSHQQTPATYECAGSYYYCCLG